MLGRLRKAAEGAALETLGKRGRVGRLVSVPCLECFLAQPAAWREAVLPPGLPRVAVEAGVRDYWRKYVGLDGAVVGLDGFGESGPAPELFRRFGITAGAVCEAVVDLLEEGETDRLPSQWTTTPRATRPFQRRRVSTRTRAQTAATYSLVSALRRFRTPWPIRCSFSMSAKRT